MAPCLRWPRPDASRRRPLPPRKQTENLSVRPGACGTGDPPPPCTWEAFKLSDRRRRAITPSAGLTQPPSSAPRSGDNRMPPWKVPEAVGANACTPWLSNSPAHFSHGREPGAGNRAPSGAPGRVPPASPDPGVSRAPGLVATPPRPLLRLRTASPLRFVSPHPL